MKLKPEISLYVRSMGKALRVTAIFDSTHEANYYMARSDNDDAVVCCATDGKLDLIFFANTHDKGITIPKEK